MILYLVRHSKAEASNPLGDPHRRLTDKGILRVTEVMTRFPPSAPKPEIILHSLYIRAVQTAKLIATHWNLSLGLLQEKQALIPHEDYSQVVSMCREQAQLGVNVVMLVSHNPLMEICAAAFLTKDRIVEPTFHTPSIFAIDWDSNSTSLKAQILWKIHPNDFSF